MTVAELRAVLETLPARFDETEVLMYTSAGLCHIESVELDRRKDDADYWDARFGPKPAERYARKVRLRASRGFRRARLWHESPPEWELCGWWPKEAAEIGLGPLGGDV